MSAEKIATVVSTEVAVPMSAIAARVANRGNVPGAGALMAIANAITEAQSNARYPWYLDVASCWRPGHDTHGRTEVVMIEVDRDTRIKAAEAAGALARDEPSMADVAANLATLVRDCCTYCFSTFTRKVH